MAQCVLALDFGGTKLAAGLWDTEAATWLVRGRCETPASQGAEVVIEHMLSLGDGLCEKMAARPLAVGVSFDGPVDAEREHALRCHHVADWEHFPLRQRVSEHYGCSAAIDNDANLAAWAEQRCGAGRGCSDLLYMTISTGVGGGLVLGGELYRGHQGLAGEIGHMCLDDQGPICPCGRRGCLEAMAAGPAIVRWARSLAPEPLPGDLSAADVSLAAQSGALWAAQALERSASALGWACGNALNLLNLECVVLGGGVMQAGAGYLAQVRASAMAHTLSGIAVEIRQAALGDSAPMRGAAMLAEELAVTMS